jgi:RND family efflux transporter MFP subunit
VAAIAYSDAAVPVRVTGLLSRRSEADLSFKIGGVIETVFVRAGDSVAAGQVLAQLRLDEIEAQVVQARSAAEKTQRDLKRIENLHTNRVATLENLQDAQTAVEVAAAQLRIAEFNHRYATITAPAPGKILRRQAEPGELVGSGKPILGFASDNDGWLVRAGLAERDVARLRVGDRTEVVIGGGDEKPVLGRISNISEAADPATRTTPIEILLDAAPAAARSGMVVVVAMHPANVDSRPIVPASALIEGADRQATLFVVTDGTRTVRRVKVDVEALTEGEAYLRTRLPAQAKLVVQGGEYLRDGATVEIEP